MPRRRFLRLRLGQVLPDQLAAGLRQPRQRLQLLLADALPQERRITLENLADEDMTLYYQINYTLTDVPEDAAYFHAQFRRVNPLPYKDVYTILDGVKGRGQYVGTYLAWEVHSTGWWGEGEIKFFMDGDKEFPTICGTGTEDYFCGSYNFDAKARTARSSTTSSPRPTPACAQVIRPDGHLPGPAALRPVPLAHRRPGPLREGPEGDHPGAGLAGRAAATCRCRTTSPRSPSGTRPSRTPSSPSCRTKDYLEII